MKIRGAKQVHYDSGPNMTPLVDVVMVILIFLMMAGSFGGLEHYLVSKMPYKQMGGEGGTPKTDFVPDEPLELRVESPTPTDWQVHSGRIRVQNNVDELAGQLAALRREMVSAGKAVDKIQVVISPRRHTQYKHLIEIYQAAMRAEFTKIAFATSR